MVAVNHPNFYAMRDQERRAVADQIAAGRAHQAVLDGRTAQGRAWQRQVAEAAYQHNNAFRAFVPDRSPDEDSGWGPLVFGVAVAAGALWLLSKARQAAEHTDSVPHHPGAEADGSRCASRTDLR